MHSRRDLVQPILLKGLNGGGTRHEEDSESNKQEIKSAGKQRRTVSFTREDKM